MTYCISDIHGEYDLFMKLLDKIRYSDNDRLIVCGDFLDKGAASIRLAKTIFDLPNSYSIMGNHEYMFFKFYRSLADDAANLDFDRILSQLQGYFPQDGYLLDWDTVDILVDLPFYLEERDFICVHAGVPLNDTGRIRPLKQASPEELVYDRRFKEPTVRPNGTCVFFGHTPTNYVHENSQILAYLKPGRVPGSPDIRDYYKVHLDIGTPLSGMLGCFCVDTCQAFYVARNR